MQDNDRRQKDLQKLRHFMVDRDAAAVALTGLMAKKVWGAEDVKKLVQLGLMLLGGSDQEILDADRRCEVLRSGSRE